MGAFDGIWGTIAPAAITGVGGYALSVWRSRALPWLSITEFDQASANSDIVSVSESFARSTEASWFMQGVFGGQRRLGEVSEAYFSARRWIRANSIALSTLTTGIQELQNSSSNDEKISAIRHVLSVSGVSDLLDLALWRKRIVAPEFDPEIDQVLQFSLNKEKNGGCFSLYLPESTIFFGDSFLKSGNHESSLKPFMEIVSRLEKDKMLAIFEQLVPIWKDQNEHHRAIDEEGETITQTYSRWTAHFSIANFGSTPIVVFPEDCVLVIRAKNARTFRLPCNLVRVDEDGDNVAVKGAVLVQSGHTNGLLLVTKQTQKEIDGGTILRSVFEASDSDAHIELHYTGRDIPWKRKATSGPLKFTQ